MARNKVSKAFEKVLRDKGLLSEVTAVKAVIRASELYCELLPPPSTNNLYLTTRSGKRVKTPEYREWLEDAVPKVEKLKPPTKFPTGVVWLLKGKWNERRDGGNTEKAILDSMVDAKVIPDDNLKYVNGERWVYEPSGEPPTVVVMFEEVSHAE
jgi:Holliday junction resolvase RusA-like endonuclease